MISIFLFAASCNSPKNDTTLTGVYTASYEHEFGKTEDTLNVTKPNEGNSVYQISRHSGVIKKLDGKEFPKELLIETWSLEYNADKQTLTELGQGRVLIWDSNRLILQFGKNKYKKISGL